jgi:hypothetical protein
MVLSDDNEKELRFVNDLSARAKLFVDCFAEGDYYRVLRMLPDRTSERAETLILLSDISDIKAEVRNVLAGQMIGDSGLTMQFKGTGTSGWGDDKDEYSIFLESTQDYSITISDRNSREYGSPIQTGVVYLVFFRDEKNKEAVQCKNLASYIERGRNLAAIQAQIGFRLDGLPALCSISTNYVSDPKTATVKWDKNGAISKFENLQILVGKNKNWTIPEKKETEKTTPLALLHTTVQFPKTNHKEVQTVFDHLNKLSSIGQVEDLHGMYKLPLTKSQEAVGGICFTSKKLRYIAFAGFQGRGSRRVFQGYFLRFDSEGHELAYTEGVMHPYGLDRIDNSIDHFTATKWNALDMNFVTEKGVEILFHKNGFPSKYRTHVKQDRLFGRQIEWNDKGEVVSDVDLDIPKPWADAPKKEVTEK